MKVVTVNRPKHNVLNAISAQDVFKQKELKSSVLICFKTENWPKEKETSANA